MRSPRPGAPVPASARRIGCSLDALNFFLADVRGGIGPYLNVFLVTQQHWTQTQAGLVTALGGWLALALQTPIGAAIDQTRRKRELIIAGLAALGVGSAVIWAFPAFWPVMAANLVISGVGDVFGPAVAALTLGLAGKEALARRIGRNAAWDHAGNVIIALAAGAVGRLFSQRDVFLLAPVFAVLAVLAAWSIPAKSVDYRRSRGLAPVEAGGDEADDDEAGDWRDLPQRGPLMALMACAALFHLANAPLLPLVGQKLAQANAEWATAMMSVCIIAAQMVMIPMSLLVGHTADRWGRKPLLLLGFAVLPVRACLYTLSDDSTWLIAVQLLDGVGAGIWNALIPLVVADLTRGTGHYTLALGALATAQGIGAATSGLLAGELVDHFGYAAAFLASGGIAAAALAALMATIPETRLAAMPETRPAATTSG